MHELDLWSSNVSSPPDLIGRTVGNLKVLERLGKLTYGYLWRCQCSCGKTEDIPYRQLVGTKEKGRVEACTTCRYARTCVICGQPFQSRARRITCYSEECHSIRRQQIGSAYRAEHQSELRDKWKKAAKARRDQAKITPDPKLEESVRKAKDRRKHRRESDAEYRARLHKQGRDYYRKVTNTAKQLIANNQTGAALSIHQRKLAYDRSYRRSERERIRLDPVKYRLHLDRQREAGRKYYAALLLDSVRLAERQKRQQEAQRQRALTGLMQTGLVLGGRHDKAD